MLRMVGAIHQHDTVAGTFDGPPQGALVNHGFALQGTSTTAARKCLDVISTLAFGFRIICLTSGPNKLVPRVSLECLLRWLLLT